MTNEQAGANLTRAKKAQEDEFYTQLSDIDNELRHYRQHFKNKVILCNCDDPFESNFFKHFAMHFNDYELKKLIGVCYHSSPIAGGQLSLFDNLEDYEPAHGVVLEIEELTDLNGDGAINLADVEIYLQTQKDKVRTLKGDGDFRSEESIELLEEADIVCTNPPFSKFREFVQLLLQEDKKFLIIGSQNAITYKEFFPLLMTNKIWIGYKFGDMAFKVPEYYQARETRYWEDESGQKWRSLGNICWYTNLEIPKRHEALETWAKYSIPDYPEYDNYKAIEVSKTAEIPRDYRGVMGVPITFMDKYCPEQFEIIGLDRYTVPKKDLIGGRLAVNGNTKYARILIRYTDQWIIDHPEDFE